MLQKIQIISDLKDLVGEINLILNEKELKEGSVDRYRKYEKYNDIFTQPIPIAIVQVENTEQVSEILKYCNNNYINVIPRAGNSALERMLESTKENHIILDVSKLNQIINIDTYNMQVTVQAGVPLEDLENLLREKNLTTGHSPQSKPLAQMGGIVGVRSIGQFSTLYGGIEDMVVGLETVFADGTVSKIKNVPRRAAGPDIRHVIVGNEGSLSVLTEVTVKLFPYYPKNNKFLGYLVADMEKGIKLLREVMVKGYKPSVARLYDLEDAKSHFPNFYNNKCVLIFMTEGVEEVSNANFQGISKLINSSGKTEKIDNQLIENWFNNLNWHEEQVEEEKKEILQTNNIGFTTEVAADWENVIKIYNSVIEKVTSSIPYLTWVGGHSSHSYINGTNLYFVYYYDVKNINPEEEMAQYHDKINKIIIEESLKYGGTMVHHHGVGKARAPWIKEEYGSSFYILKSLKNTFDPKNVMNAGNIIPEEYLEDE
ncbi:FAD-binding oxidoreductase [Staphylococcus pseudoxylosus]|uniref:FAD-binding oxidoreductase n=1 Tax=Staphylococcus pseudoxylosus TaxID=2282419 RepID=UPI002DBA9E5C|nr:FAD-binding oxidoreductase [Staphylococcus pseudoxylosus]MEB7754895.1 FAD-binding oxidoreductase [Staphylococcus pseudoxylosus]